MSQAPAMASPSPASALLGWRLITVDLEAGTIEVGFEAKAEFLNPFGSVQGGMLAAMLDDTMGPLVVMKTQGAQFAPSQDLHITFFRPVFPGPVRCTAEIVRMGRTSVHLDSRLYDGEDRLAAKAVQTARLTPLDPAIVERLKTAGSSPGG